MYEQSDESLEPKTEIKCAWCEESLEGHFLTVESNAVYFCSGDCLVSYGQFEWQ